MDTLKKFFPYSFGVRDGNTLAVKIIVYIVAGIIAGVVCWIVGIVPLIGPIISWVLSTVSGLYILAGIILAILNFCKVI